MVMVVVVVMMMVTTTTRGIRCRSHRSRERMKDDM
jgi:hypothetical protein